MRDDEYATDFETASNPYFDNYNQLTKLTSALKRSGNNSQRLAGGSNETVGLMKSLYVSKGDKVKAEMYGKYIAATGQDDAINTSALITALVNMLPGGVISGEGPLVSNNLTSGYTSAAIADNSNEQSPRAYLNYIVLDKDFNYLNSGFDRLSTSAEDPGDGSGTHQKLSFEEILIDQDGYLIVFLSNESQQPVEVFWDDFRVDHHHNAVLQADDYYPFGLTFNSYRSKYNKKNKMNTFQDQELDEETGWVQFKWRNHQPELGRFFNVDPLAEDYYYNSPYAFSENKVVAHIELEGLESVSIVTIGNDVKYRGQRVENKVSGSSHKNIKSTSKASVEFKSTLKNVSNQDSKGIGFLGVFSHGVPNKIFGKDGYQNGISKNDLSQLSEAVKNGDIKFAEGAVIYLGACNAGTGWGDENSFAQELSEITGASVVAAENDQVGPKDESNGNMVYTTANPSENEFKIYEPGTAAVGIGPTVDVNQLIEIATTRTSDVPQRIEPIKPEEL
ncbi:hypothetical protein C9994_09320 [Marivirga lumbricoides]|uniref:DUF4347 domain-containing protein n=1 Tax=Marivirga lumbricoides TaxID=1046115 RepID=A0A2T4DQD8_9BACT|nr:hypothetical protein C9994_09320 [Marivirga lumbricoides]